MTDTTLAHGGSVKPDLSAGRLKKRRRAELRFKLYGLGAILVAVAFLAVFLGTIVSRGVPGFFQTYVLLDVQITPDVADPEGGGTADSLRRGNYATLLRNSLLATFPDTEGRKAKRELANLLSPIARYNLQDEVVADPALVGKSVQQWFLLSDDVDRLIKSETTAEMPADQRRLSDRQVVWIDKLEADGKIETRFDWNFFTVGNSAEPEAAGLGAAMVGSLYTMVVMLLLCVPVGVMAAIYLEEFAPKNKVTEIIEININNLAAVPSIVFGLLGLAVFLSFFGLPRSAPLGRRHGPGADDLADHHHHHACGPKSSAALDSPGRRCAWRLQAAVDHASRAALGPAGNPHRHHHRLGAGAGRDRALADDRHVRLRAGGARRDPRHGNGDPCADLLLGRPGRARLRGQDLGRDHGAAGLPHPDERRGGPAAATFRETVVMTRELNLAELAEPSAAVLAGLGPIPKSEIKLKMRARNTNVYYGEAQALKQVDLDIPERKVMALIGPSGCGKSTFLRCLNRMNDVIDGCRVTGDIRLDGEDIHNPKLDVVQLRARIGMVFQKPNPFPKSIFDNIAYGPRIHGVAKNSAMLEEVVTTSLQRAGLWEEVKDRLHQPGTGLSGGQQQRLCIARAIAVSPEVILMDEPCSALDPIATAKVEELIDDLRRNFTIVIVTHSMQQAARVSQNTAFFHLGSLVEASATDELFTNPQDERTQGYITGRYG